MPAPYIRLVVHTTGLKRGSDNTVSTNPELGAYGLRLRGVNGAERLLVPSEASWPLLDIRIETGDATVERDRFDTEFAQIRLRTGGSVSIERKSGRTTFTVPVPLSPDELVHPYLAPVAAVTAHWHGRESLHGGGIALRGGVIGVVGDRLAGKSSLLAALAARGIDVVCDDMLVVEDAHAFAGPRTIDLREDAADALGLGEDIGVAGARSRWRVRLGPVPPRLRLAGWIFLDWAERVEVTRVPASETLQRLLRNRGIRVPPLDPAYFVQLGAMPAWEVKRPRSWSAVPDVVDAVLDVAAG
jgi:hypothetical protein